MADETVRDRALAALRQSGLAPSMIHEVLVGLAFHGLAIVPVEPTLDWDEAIKRARQAIYDADGRGMIGRSRHHLEQRVARALRRAAAAPPKEPTND